jgi:hypothetical protein
MPAIALTNDVTAIAVDTAPRVMGVRAVAYAVQEPTPAKTMRRGDTSSRYRAVTT